MQCHGGIQRSFIIFLNFAKKFKLQAASAWRSIWSSVFATKMSTFEIILDGGNVAPALDFIICNVTGTTRVPSSCYHARLNRIVRSEFSRAKTKDRNIAMKDCQFATGANAPSPTSHAANNSVMWI
jgi:hypothetical protein